MTIRQQRWHIAALLLLLFVGDKVPSILDEAYASAPDPNRGASILGQAQEAAREIKTQREIDDSTRNRPSESDVARVASMYGFKRRGDTRPEALASSRGARVYQPARSPFTYGKDFDILASIRQRQASRGDQPQSFQPFQSDKDFEQAAYEVRSAHDVPKEDIRLYGHLRSPGSRPESRFAGRKSVPESERMNAVRAYDDIVESAAEEYGVDPNLIRAMMRAESSGDPAASSGKAMGLMQLAPDTAKELGVTDIWDAEQNIRAGARYMAQMLERYDGDWDKALAAYNAGPGNVDKHGGIPPFKETREYVPRVKGYYDNFRRNL